MPRAADVLLRKVQEWLALFFFFFFNDQPKKDICLFTLVPSHSVGSVRLSDSLLPFLPSSLSLTPSLFLSLFFKHFIQCSPLQGTSFDLSRLLGSHGGHSQLATLFQGRDLAPNRTLSFSASCLFT